MAQNQIKGITVELWARIKKSSKYYGQGLDPKTDKPMTMPITHLRECQGDYIYETMTGVYRREDLDLFVRRKGDTLQRI